MNLVGIKYFWVDLESTRVLDDGTEVRPSYAEVIADVEIDGSISEFRKRYSLAEMEVGDYVSGENLKEMGIEPTTRLAALITDFIGLMLQVLSSETGYPVAESKYVAPSPTLRQEIGKAQEDIANLQQAVAELSTMVSVLTKSGF